MWYYPAWLIALLVAVTTVPVQAQAPVAARLERFERWQPELPPAAQTRMATVPVAANSRSNRRALIGGAIGAVGGVVVCTVISNLADDSADGFSTCTLKGYLLTGSAGFVIGFAFGSIL